MQSNPRDPQQLVRCWKGFPWGQYSHLHAWIMDTGRSLSEVSRYINEASKPYKYQCIAVDDKQLCRLTVVLRKLTPDARRVKHLFISSIKRDRGARFFQTDKNRLLITVASTITRNLLSPGVSCAQVSFTLPIGPHLAWRPAYGRRYSTYPCMLPSTAAYALGISESMSSKWPYSSHSKNSSRFDAIADLAVNQALFRYV